MGEVASGVSQAQVDALSQRIGAVESDMLTGADRQQAVRVQLTPNAAGAAYKNDAGVIENSATNTQVTIVIQRVPKTLTVSVLGAVLNIFTPVTTPVWVNIFIRAPV